MAAHLHVTNLRWWKLIGGLVAGLVAAGAAALFLRWPWQPAFVPHAAAPLSAAQFEVESAKLSSLLEQRGVEAAFSYAQSRIAADPSYAKVCHPLLHELGHAAYTYYGSYAPAIAYQNELCDSGYTHGVVEEYLSSGHVPIAQALQAACQPGAATFRQWQCYHGLGHGAMIALDGDVAKSIALCGGLPSSFSSDACVNGVFMQHFVVTAHDGSVPKVNPTGLGDCQSQPARYKTVCYTYAPSAYLTVHDRQYQAALHWCQTAEQDYVPACITGVGSQAMKENIGDAGVARRVCQLASGTAVHHCISGAVAMDVFFHASAAHGQALCSGQFKAYRATCLQAVAAQKQQLPL